jgi:hypothetical protein
MLLVRRIQSWYARRRFAACLRAENAELFLEVLLQALRLGILVDEHLRHSVAHFSATYQITTHDRRVDVGLTFHDGVLVVHEGQAGPFDATLCFRDSHTLMGFFSPAQPDLLGSVLDQRITIEGNLNYIYRLAYLVNHLRLEVLGVLKAATGHPAATNV